MTSVVTPSRYGCTVQLARALARWRGTPFGRQRAANPRQWARDLGIEASRQVNDFNRGATPADGPIDVVDLFCGCGGLSTGFEQVGRMVPSYSLAAAVDIDSHSAATYSANLPISPTLIDLAAVAKSPVALKHFTDSLPLRRGSPLVVIGGPPCQGFSAHRKKNLRSLDRRNQLVAAFAAIVRKLQPQFFVFENVPEVAAQRHWDGFEALQRVLRSDGYVIRAQIHNLAGFGVPQERFRAIVMGSKKPFTMQQPFVEVDEYTTVRQAIGHLPRVNPGKRSVDPMHYCTNHRPTTVATIKRVPKDGGRRPQGIGPRCLDRVDGFRDVYGRMYWDRPANTITAYARNPASGRYVHPEENRGLTIREAALLQGFPHRFGFEGPFDDKFLQIGNAVPPIFSSCLAAHVLGELIAPDSVDDDSTITFDLHQPTSNSFSSGIAGRKKFRH